MSASNTIMQHMPTTSILDACVFGIIIVDDNHKVLYWNSWLEQHSSVSKKDALNKNLFELFPEMVSNRIYNAVGSAIRQGSSSFLSQALNKTPFPLYDPRKNNEPVQQAISITPVMIVDDQHHCMIQIENVSASVNREKQLRQMKSQAEHDRAVAENLSQMKSNFLSTVSHELRTPLTSISGSLSLVEGGVLGEVPEKIMEMIQLTSRNTDRLLSLVNDILDIEKLESGKMEYYKETIDVCELLERAVNENNGMAIKLGVQFSILDCDDSLNIHADHSRLMQVMSNLMSNAAKFSPQDGIVKLKAEKADDQIRISVTDDGPGISSAFRESIFEKFSQSKTFDNTHPGGTGLGLSICEAIIHQHDGVIDFFCPESGGTEFFFTLPPAVANT